MHTNNYKETIDWLFDQFPAYQKIGSQAYKPDLGNISELLRLIGDPQEQLNFIHIAGTNGKGSTSSLLASILTVSTEKVGLFTSPHIVDYRERIRINGEVIPEQSVISFCNLIRSTNFSVKPSFFEITFAMAVHYFSAQKCSICVIETGLGGRLDATNIITPLLSIITNISLDHTNFLGNTIELIAREKGGIIKERVPVIIGERNSITQPVFEEIASNKHTTIQFADDINERTAFDNHFIADYQKINFRTVYAAILALNQNNHFQITSDCIQKGIENLEKNSGFRARLQVMRQEPMTIFDVSHNPDGIKVTLEAVEKMNKGQLHLVYATSNDKDLETIFELFPKNATFYFTQFTGPRSANANDLMEMSKKYNLFSKKITSPKAAVEMAQNSANKQDTVLVFGSFFLISELI